MEIKPVSILVIDGDIASRSYLIAMLGKSGFTMFSVSLGRAGFFSAWKDQLGAFILDPVLTVINDLELVTRLRRDLASSAA
jgi:PleD family two-component response regulator